MLKKLLLPLMALAMVFSSCSKDEDDDNNNTGNTENTGNSDNTLLPEVKEKLLKKVSNGYDTFYFSYDEKGRLVSIDENGDITTINYKDGIIEVTDKIGLYPAKVNDEGFVTSVSARRFGDSDDVLKLSYNSNNTFKSSVNEEYDGAYKFTVKTSADWKSGNLVKLTEEEGKDKNVCNYKYGDELNNVNLDLNAILGNTEGDYEILDIICATGVKSKNLVKEYSIKYSDGKIYSVSCTYTVNDEGYLVEAVVTRPYGGNTTYSFEYEE